MIRKFVATVLSFQLLAAPIYSVGAQSQAPTAEAIAKTKQSQKDSIVSFLVELDTHYGLEQFKNQLFSVTLDSLRAKYFQLIDEARLPHETTSSRTVLTRADLQQLLIALAADLRDGHTNIRRLSLDTWSTGIIARKVGDKLIVVGFQDKVFAPDRSLEPLEMNAEILSIDGISVQELAKRYMVYAQVATYETRYKVALENLLISRYALFPAKKDNSPVTITFKNPGDEKVYTLQTHWSKLDPKDPRYAQFIAPAHNQFDYPVEAYKKNEQLKKLTAGLKSSSKSEAYKYGDRGTVSYFKTGLLNLKSQAMDITNVGAAVNELIKSKSPALQEVASNTTKKVPLKPITRLEAYTVNHEGKRVGVLRIPDYSPDTYEEFLRELSWIRLVLKNFEANTDGLVIDQLSNGGGYVAYVTALAGAFATDKPLKSYSVQVKISENYLNNVEEFTDVYFNTNYTNIQLSDATAQYLRSLFEKGITLSGPIPIMGTGNQLPEEKYGVVYPDDGVRYTKPIMILNDLMSGSGGDFFPMMMQANQRALVFGSNSMGLGGPVYTSYDTLSKGEMSFRNTFGIARTFNGTHIENAGVTADIQRNVRYSDIHSPRPFSQFAQDALDAAVDYFSGKSIADIRSKVDSRKAKLPQASAASLTALQAGVNMVANSTNNLLSKIQNFQTAINALGKEIETTQVSVDQKENLQIEALSELSKRDEYLAGMMNTWAYGERLVQILDRYENQSNLNASEKMYLKKVWGGILTPEVIKELRSLATNLDKLPYMFVRPSLRDKAEKRSQAKVQPQTCSAAFN